MTPKHKILYLISKPISSNSFQASVPQNTELITSSSHEEALDILKQYEIALVIQKQKTLDKIALDFLTKVKEEWANTSCIVLTESTIDKAFIDSLNNIGIYQYSNKSLGNIEVLGMIAQALEVYQLKVDLSKPKQIENQLIELKNQFQNLFEFSPDSILIYHDNIITHVNKAFLDLFGYNSKEEVIGKPTLETLLTPSSYEKIKKTRPKTQKQGFTKTSEIQNIKKDGTIFLTENHVSTIMIGGKLHIQVISRDITKRKEIEKQLNNNTQLLYKAEKLAHLGSWYWDIKKNVVVWSEEKYQIYGVTKDSFQPSYEAWLDTLHPDDCERVNKIVQNLYANKGQADFEYRIIRPNGQERILHSWNTIEVDKDNNPIKMVGASLDITESKKAKQALEDSALEFRELFDSSLDEIYLVSPVSMKMLNLNATACKNIGYSKEELIGQRMFKIIPPLEFAKNSFRMLNIMKGKVEIFCAAHKRKDGSLYPMEIKLKVIEYRGSKAILAVVRDISDRQRIEKELQESQKYLTFLNENSPDLIVTLNKNLQISYINRVLAGFSFSEVINISAWDFIPSHLHQEYKLFIDKAFEGEKQEFETEVYGAHGQKIWYKVRMSILNKDQSSLLVILTDITKRKKIELQNNLINAIAHKLNSNISISDFFQYIFLELQKIKNFPNLYIANYNQQDDRINFLFYANEHKIDSNLPPSRTREKGLSEYIIKTKKGLLLNCEELKSFHEKNGLKVYGKMAKNWLGVPLLSDDRVLGVLAVQSFSDEDIYTKTDLDLLSFIGTQLGYLIQRQQAEQEIKQLANIVSRSSDAILSIKKGKIVSWNAGAEELLGYSPKEIIGTPLEKLVPNSLKAECAELLRAAEEGKTIQSFETVRIKKDGTAIFVNMSTFPLTDKSGNITGVSSILRDISVQKEAEQIKEEFTKKLEVKVNERTLELEQTQNELALSLKKEKELNELKSRFVSTVSHQFRTPLTTIQSNMGVLLMQKSSMAEEFKPRFEKVYSRVVRQVEKMTDLMNDVLILGKINAVNTTSLTLKTIDLVALCQEIATNYNEIQEDNRKLVFSIIGEAYPVSLNSKLVEQAISNLISNAFKYSTKRPAPSLSILFDEKNVQVSVKDSGIGIPTEELKHLFTPFYRASNSNKISGTGLGLAITKEYIEMNGGMIRVNSKLNKGTEFTIVFNQT